MQAICVDTCIWAIEAMAQAIVDRSPVVLM